MVMKKKNPMKRKMKRKKRRKRRGRIFIYLSREAA